MARGYLTTRVPNEYVEAWPSAALIRTCRTQFHMSTAAINEYTGVGCASISNIEAGRWRYIHNATAVKLGRLAALVRGQA